MTHCPRISGKPALPRTESTLRVCAPRAVRTSELGSPPNWSAISTATSTVSFAAGARCPCGKAKRRIAGRRAGGSKLCLLRLCQPLVEPSHHGVCGVELHSRHGPSVLGLRSHTVLDKCFLVVSQSGTASLLATVSSRLGGL